MHIRFQMWNIRLQELRDFKKSHGHCEVDLDYTSPHYDLALWIREQRMLHLRASEGIPSHLEQLHIEELDNLGFNWNLEPG